MKVKDIVVETLDTGLSSTWTSQQWQSWLDQQIKAGEIYKKDWEDAKYALNRKIEKISDHLKDQYYFIHRGDTEFLNLFQDLYYDMPHQISGLKKMEKTAKNSPDGPFKHEVLKFAAEYNPIADKLAALKSMIVTATQRREVKKAQAAQQKKAEAGSAKALIDALRENRNQYVEEAKKRAHEWIIEKKNTLKERGGVNAIAPEPQRGLFSTDYKAYKNATTLRTFWSFVDRVDVDEYVSEEAKAAGASYDAWTHKLVQKIGKPVTQAQVSGDPWHGSYITVKTKDGEEQSWHTKMILNRSKLGKMFNQFPTRRV